MSMTSRRVAVKTLLASLLARRSAFARADTAGGDAIPRGRQFLVRLLDPELDLLPEYPGATVYWLYHDNYLAAHLLESTHAELAARIRRAIAAHGVTGSGKIEILFREAERPLPFRLPRNVDVARRGNRLIRTEVLGEEPHRGWAEYADLRFLAAIARAADDPARAGADLTAGLAQWDGTGFRDPAWREHRVYAAYKLALALLAARALEHPVPFAAEMRTRLLGQQDATGGFVTDYAPDGALRGLPNVETTCISLLALAGA